MRASGGTVGCGVAVGQIVGIGVGVRVAVRLAVGRGLGVELGVAMEATASEGAGVSRQGAGSLVRAAERGPLAAAS